ncbi:hypothetical protein ACOME3_004301 [Neoechinorhynchus agilis]
MPIFKIVFDFTRFKQLFLKSTIVAICSKSLVEHAFIINPHYSVFISSSHNLPHLVPFSAVSNALSDISFLVISCINDRLSSAHFHHFTTNNSLLTPFPNFLFPNDK